MANMDHVQLVKRGRDTVARWREEHPGENMDLNASYLSFARIAQVDLRGADIRDSDLMGAMMARANLSNCRMNPCHLYRANLTQADLSRALLNGANLRGANLTGADLSDADLDRAILSDANLTGANLTGANLARVNFAGANLTDANLTGANLNRAALNRVNMANSTLRSADFYEAVFNNAVLTGADFDGSIIGYTVFQNCDFRGAVGLENVRHDAPSTIGVDTLYRSRGHIADAFLRSSGLPEALCGFQQTILDGPDFPGDCFISCASDDTPFAQTLMADLQEKGIRCWVFSEDARGSALVERHSTSDQEEVERWVRDYDKLVVVCTEAALENETLRNDIIQAQEMQQNKDQWTLFLVTPDSTLTQSRARLARTLSSEHVIFELQQRESDPEEYQKGLTRLADGLRENQPRAAGIPKSDDL
ncbi:MAG: toll/interleukin-1 receptor domain-containing protein [Chloroflexi bacterium]|nr:toll/interleukin-1 receptor domain-containing protein [Chloroflexota bacterium]